MVAWWQRLTAMGLMLCVLVVGCVGPFRVGELQSKLHEHPAPVVQQTQLTVHGELMLRELAILLYRAYQITLSFPDTMRDRFVVLDGEASEIQLRGLLEDQLKCQIVAQGRVWSIVGDGERFSIIVNGSIASGIAGIADVTSVGGRYVASGEMRNLSALRRIVDAVELPRSLGRLRLWLVERSAAERYAVSVSPGWSAGYREGWFSSFDADVVADVFLRSGSVEREIELLATDGEPIEYRDEPEVRVERFLASGDSGQTFRSESEVLAAGLSVKLLPVRLGRVWRIGGELEVSDFSPGGSDIPDRVRRVLTVQSDMGSGSCVRLGRVHLRRDGVAGGVLANAFSAGKDRAASVFDVWVAIEDVTFDDAKVAENVADGS